MKTSLTPDRLHDPDAPLAATLSLLREREFNARRRPYPGDGTNGPNVLVQSGIVRSDIRASFGNAGTAVASGTPLTVTLKLVNVNNNCAPVAGYAVYAWHCDASGRYSLYSAGATTQSYLRGVQVSDATAPDVHHDLPRRLSRPLAAHPLRNIRERA